MRPWTRYFRESKDLDFKNRGWRSLYVKDTIILPLVDVSFGMGAGDFRGDRKARGYGGIGGKMTPSAVLVIRDGQTKLVMLRIRKRLQNYWTWFLM